MFKLFIIFIFVAPAVTSKTIKSRSSNLTKNSTWCSCAYFEEHSINSNGYIISLSRLVVPDDGVKRSEVVFAAPGHGANGLVTTISGNNSLGCYLFANGFDVWLFNSRGTKFSNNHTSLLPESKEYNDYSFNEIALEDLPATIDYVLNVTAVEKLHYLGHSAGCTIISFLLTFLPDYQRKMKSVQLLAPAVFLETDDDDDVEFRKSVITRLYAVGLLDFFGMHTVPRGGELEDIKGESKYINYTQLNEWRKIYQTGVSLKQFIHLIQITMYDKFALKKFDYLFPWENKEKYGTEEAPECDFSLVKNKIDIWYSKSDVRVSMETIQALLSALPNAEAHHVEGFTHLDFILANVSSEVLFPRLVKKMLSY